MDNSQTNSTPVAKPISNLPGQVEIQSLYQKIQQVQLPKELFDKAVMMIQRIELTLKYGGNINQLDILTQYIDWISCLPWFAETKDNLDITHAKTVMDTGHYGLTEVKNRVLEYLGVLIMQRQQNLLLTAHAPILFFVGLAGTGKTTFAKQIANALDRKFARIAFGGLSSALDLRGLSKVQPEAEPGMIIKALRRVQCKNPVILLDELDRISPAAQGEIMGVLIELLDPEQNDRFSDHYIDFPFDLSHVIFVATANNTRSIATAVLDRMEVIQMPSYSDAEKIIISQNYILPHYLVESGLTKDAVIIDKEVWDSMARLSGYDPGIRSVERKVEAIVRKVAYKIVAGQGTSFTINKDNMREYIE